MRCTLIVRNTEAAGKKRGFYVGEAHFAPATGRPVEADDAVFDGAPQRIRGTMRMALVEFAPSTESLLVLRFAGVPAEETRGTLSVKVSVGVLGGEEAVGFPDVRVSAR